ncbi:MAG: hypothetical protein KGI97_00420 [Alphaproteobacteria bacterium]|nr:hypothetical protein [Alphaproteobacteria bacterium]
MNLNCPFFLRRGNTGFERHFKRTMNIGLGLFGGAIVVIIAENTAGIFDLG